MIFTASVSVDATIIEPKHHKNYHNGNSINSPNTTNDFSQYPYETNQMPHRATNKKNPTLPTDCFCEPEIER